MIKKLFSNQIKARMLPEFLNQVNRRLGNQNERVLSKTVSLKLLLKHLLKLSSLKGFLALRNSQSSQNMEIDEI